MVPTSSHFVAGAFPNAVSVDVGSPQTLFPAPAEALGLAEAELLVSAGAGWAFPCSLGSKKITTAAAISATTSAAAMMKPGLVNGLLSVVLSVDWLKMNLPLLGCWLRRTRGRYRQHR
jgi:hypothetical protein